MRFEYIAYAVALLLVGLFGTLWVISEKKRMRLEHQSQEDAMRIRYLERRSRAYGALIDRLTASPVACKVCGRFLRGRNGMAIVRFQPFSPFANIAHVHPECAPRLIPDRDIVVNFANPQMPVNSVEDSIRKVQQPLMAKARQCGLSKLYNHPPT